MIPSRILPLHERRNNWYTWPVPIHPEPTSHQWTAKNISSKEGALGKVWQWLGSSAFQKTWSPLLYPGSESWANMCPIPLIWKMECPVTLQWMNVGRLWKCPRRRQPQDTEPRRECVTILANNISGGQATTISLTQQRQVPHDRQANTHQLCGNAHPNRHMDL